MSEVRYSINGKYFRDFDVYVNESKGLLDKLKPRERKTYAWAEYHGRQIDKSAPKYEAREITLTCWLVGNNVEQLVTKYNAFLSEFDKAGNQRLIVEPFGYQQYVYDVILNDKSELTKTFRDGRMFGDFSLMLLESNPIKRVLYIPTGVLSLSYNSTSEAEITFSDNTSVTVKGNASVAGKVLPGRTVTSYEFDGRNMMAKSNLELGAYLLSNGEKLQSDYYIRSINPIVVKPSQTYHMKLYKNGIGNWSFTVLFYNELGWYIGYEKYGEEASFTTPPNAKYIRYNIFDNPEGTKLLNLGWFNQYINVKIEKGNIATAFSQAPEDERYIVIAGNIDDITNFQTNAVVLWDKI